MVLAHHPILEHARFSSSVFPELAEDDCSLGCGILIEAIFWKACRKGQRIGQITRDRSAVEEVARVTL